MKTQDKVYTIGTISYNFNRRNRKWQFTDGKFTLLSVVKKGAETAHKVAAVVNGALKRTNGTGLDGLARANISKINA